MRHRGLGRVYQRPNSTCWWIQYSVRGKRRRESSGSSNRANAVKLLKKRLGEIGAGQLVGPDVEKTTFAELAQMVKDDYSANEFRSLSRAEYSLAYAEEYFKDRRAIDITTDRLTAYIAWRQEKVPRPANGTIARELAMVAKGFHLAARAGRVNRVPAFPTLRVSNARQGFFEQPEFRDVHGRLPEYLKAPVEFMYLTGWRGISEVFPLTWSQVNFLAGTVRLEPGTTKNDDARTFPFKVFPQLADLLRRQRDLTERLEREQSRVIPWVFHRRGEQILDIRKAWTTATRAAGLPGRIPHDFRRTAVRNLVRAGVPETIAMKLTGHKTRAVFDRYNITSERDLSEQVAKLASFHSVVAAGEGAHLGHSKGPREAVAGNESA